MPRTNLTRARKGLMTIMLPVLFGAVGDTALSQGVDKGCSPTVANPCTNSSSGGGSSSRPTYRDTAAEEANARRVQAHNLNQDGVAAFNRGDYALALNLFMKAHQFAPDNLVNPVCRFSVL